MRQGGPLRLLLAGFGNVGRTLAGILARRDTYPGLAGLDVAVVGITTGSHGALADGRGIDLASALAWFVEHGQFTPERSDFAELDTAGAIAGLHYDVLVELSPLSVAGRGEPAIAHVRAALERGRHVVSANKGPLAWAFRELTSLAAGRGCALLYEATVMDGVPVFSLARHGLRGNSIERIEGVLNSTTNVMLGEMERGASVGEAVACARRAGVAEADPAADIEGWDAAVKIAVLANALMGAELTPDQVERESVAEVTADRIAEAGSRGRRIKMVCEAFRDGGAVRGRVLARDVGRDDPLALVEGTGSLIRFVTDILGTFTVAEERPDLATTAYGVIADLFAVRLSRA
jgi:homoserine dehydrogenase